MEGAYMSIFTLNSNMYSQANRVETILNQLCAGSHTASKLLKGKTINLKPAEKGSTGGRVKGNEIIVDFMHNARELSESIIFEASNAELKKVFRMNENAFKQRGNISLREYARYKAKIEYNSTTTVAMVLMEMEKSGNYVPSTWGTKQRENFYFGWHKFANAPHDNRPEQTDPIQKLPTWEMYSYQIIEGINTEWMLERFLKTIANLRCKKYFKRDNLRSIPSDIPVSVPRGIPVSADHILKRARNKKSIVVYPSYITLLEQLQKDEDWIVDMKGKALSDCQFTKKMLFEAKKINSNAGRVNIFPRVVTEESGYKVVLHEQ